LSTGSRQSTSGWGRHFSRLSSSIVNTLLPPVCAHCGQVDDLFCIECRSRVVWLEEPICRQCGRPQPQMVHRCESCLAETLPLLQIRAATLHVDPVRIVLHQMKYEGYFALAQPLAELMIIAWSKWKHDFDLVLPIPLHADRRRERGYNQSELLVNALQDKLGWQGDSLALRRTKPTQPQIGLSANERRANVRGAFEADRTIVKGKKILLVDDVCTTGATLSEAAQVLLREGSESITAYCLTRAVGGWEAESI
jgi:ComF family protein